jgi:hypothetical protein
MAIVFVSDYYTLQWLLAPTVSDIRKAHRKGDYLIIGRDALGNLRGIPMAPQPLLATPDTNFIPNPSLVCPKSHIPS